MKRILYSSVLLVLSALIGQAGITSLPSIKNYREEAYYAGEFSFDVISVYVDPQFEDGEDYGTMDEGAIEAGFGGGIAATYFPVEHFGLSTKAYWWDTPASLTSVTASAIYRYPIYLTGFAPYVFAGGGGAFDSDESRGIWLVGGGLEYRISNRIGIITDYTYSWVEDAPDWGMVSLGLRFLF